MPLEDVQLDEHEGQQPEEGVPEVQEIADETPVQRSAQQHGVDERLQRRTEAQQHAAERVAHLQPHLGFQQQHDEDPGRRIHHVEQREMPRLRQHGRRGNDVLRAQPVQLAAAERRAVRGIERTEVVQRLQHEPARLRQRAGAGLQRLGVEIAEKLAGVTGQRVQDHQRARTADAVQRPLHAPLPQRAVGQHRGLELEQREQQQPRHGVYGLGEDLDMAAQARARVQQNHGGVPVFLEEQPHVPQQREVHGVLEQRVEAMGMQELVDHAVHGMRRKGGIVGGPGRALQPARRVHCCRVDPGSGSRGSPCMWVAIYGDDSSRDRTCQHECRPAAAVGNARVGIHAGPHRRHAVRI